MSGGDQPVVSVRGLHAGYRRHGQLTTVLHDLTLALHPGKSVVVVGESGSGKSTLARVLTGSLKPLRGDVTLPKARRGAPYPIQLVPQDPKGSLDPRMTIGASIAEGLRGVSGGKGAVASALERVGLDPAVADERPGALSGGQRQRVVIARALATDPVVLICDEPTSALDVSVQAGIINLLSDLQREQGFAALFITHDLALAHYLADEVLVMHRGRVVEAGSHDILRLPQQAYTQRLAASSPTNWPAGKLPPPQAREEVAG